MRHTFSIFLGILVFVLSGCKSTHTITMEDMVKHGVAVELINQRAFMLKAERLTIKNQNIPSVSSSTNFIVVDGDKATVQVSPGYGGGPNGVGGFTVNGTITGYDVVAKDNGEVSLKYHVQSISGSCDVIVKLMKGGNVAMANITSTFRGGTAMMYGKVQPIDNTIYTGRSRY